MTKIPCWRVWSCLSLAVLMLPHFAGAADDLIPLDPTVRTGKLENGLTYYIRKNAKPEKRVEFRLAVNAGSVDEDEDQLGIAHLVEHLCFNGTKNFPKNDLVHYLQSIGAAFGPDINAYTSFDETVYMLTLPTDSEEILSKGMQIMRDWANDVAFDPAEIDKERGVVVEEWRSGRGAGQRMRDKYLPIAFKDSKYAARIPIGTKESIEGATHEAIKRFYRDWYRPDNMAFIVVGDIDPDQMETAIRAKFGDMPVPANPRPKEKHAIPDHDEPLYSIISDPENSNNVVLLVHKTEAQKYRTRLDYQRELTERLFIQLLNTRLNELKQDANPPFIQAGASYGSIGARTKDAYQLYALVAENGLDRGLAAVLTESERARVHGFTGNELERAKRSLLKSLEQRYLEREKTESGRLISDLVAHFLAEEPAPGIEFDYTFAKERLPAITLDEVNRVSSQWITPKNQVTVVLNVEKPGVALPTEAQVGAVRAQVAATKIEPYQEKQLAASLLERKPAPVRVASRKEMADIGVTELTFPNGLRAVLKPSEFKNDQILFTAFRPGGQSVFPDAYHLSADLADDYLADSGVGDFSKIDLQKMLAGKRASASPRVSLYFDTMSGGASVADVETMLQLAHLYFVQPRRDENAFQSVVSRQKAMLKNILSNPSYSFFNEVQKAKFSHHPRTPNVIPTEADWATVNLDKVMEVYRSRFSSASGYTFVFVGSFTVESLVPLLETYLGSLPGTGPASGWKDLGLRPISGPVDKKIMRGTDPKSLVLISADEPVEYAFSDAHALWSLGNILQRNLTDKLREEMSGVYGFGVSGWIEKVPYAHAAFQLSIPCAPENVEKLTQAAYAEINRIKAEGLTAEELQKEVESQRRAAEKDEKENGAWLRDLESIYKYEEPFTRVSNRSELIKLVDSENLKRVAIKYLNTEKTVRFTMYPETK